MNPYLAQVFTIGNAIIDFFLNTDWRHVLFWLKIISFIVTVAMVWGIVWVLRKHRALMLSVANLDTPKAPFRDVEAEKFVHETWESIRKLWVSDSVAEKRLALIEADAFFDNMLRDRNVPGDTMAERLSSPEAPQFKNIRDISFAHKFRNELVHENGTTFDVVDATLAFTAYEQALKDLGVI